MKAKLQTNIARYFITYSERLPPKNKTHIREKGRLKSFLDPT